MFFLGVLAIALGAFVIMKGFQETVLCIPNDNKSAVQITAKNVTIEEITLKYNSGVLHPEENSQLLSINDVGVEYVRVYYRDHSNNQSHVEFEIVVSEFNAVSITKLNALGQQIDFHTY